VKILIVDDDAVNIGVLAAALRDEYEILTALDGFTAIALMKEHTPDLVLLDIMMPEIDGLQVARMMRAHETLAAMPVIFVTAIASQEGEQSGLELGAVDYLTKPVNLKLAKLRIRNQLELKRQRDLITRQNEALVSRAQELELALGRVRRLEGILSICMYCKKIRTDGDDWQQLESYISEHSDTLFSHGMCPDCSREQEQSLRLMLDEGDGSPPPPI
jgi:DNA-binding response OmpR family regulator